jgi:hypothetical protein
MTLPSVGQILQLVGTAVVDVTVDEAELAAGTDATIPVDLTVGSVAGKPVYAKVVLTTTKPV